MFNKLIQQLKEYKSAVLGFSGGVDSSLVAFALKKSGIPYLCVTVQTPLQKQGELAQSAFFCEKYGINHKTIALDVLSDTDIKENSSERCYFCKKKIFGAIFDIAKELGYSTVIDGTNLDDLKEYRPGVKAKDELGTKSPLYECGFTKEDIRLISKENGLITYDMPSSPCLATRIPYGTSLDVDVLLQVAKAEELLDSIGLENVRVRVHGDVARIEAQNTMSAFTAIDERIIQRIKSYGFKFVTLDLSGYKRGCYD